MAENDFFESSSLSPETPDHHKCELTGLSGLDVSVSDGSEQLEQEDDQRFLIRQAFRLIEGEFSLVQQQVFRAYVLEEQSAESVAAAMGISPGTVYGVKSKILSRLRQELQQILE